MITIHATPQIEPVNGLDLARHLETWIREKEGEVSTITAENYRNRVRPLLLWWTATGPACNWAITPATLKQYRHWLERDYRDSNNHQPAPATVHTYCATVRIFLHWLYESQRLPVSIAHWVSMPEKPRGRGKFLDLGECQELINAASGPLKIRDWTMIAVLLGTGCRCFEAAEATKKDTDTQTGSVILKKVKFDREGRRQKGRVSIYGETTAKLIRLHLMVNGTTDDPRLLQMSNVAIGERIETLAHRAGITASTHDLRRTFCDWWMEHATDDRAYLLLKLQIGHAIPPTDTTAIHYLDLDNAQKTAQRLRRCYTSPVEELQFPGFDQWG